MAQRIRELRTAKGMTVEELAAKADISQPYLTRLESGKRGRRGLTSSVAEKLAMALETTPAEVMGIAGKNSIAGPAPQALKEDAEPYEPQEDDLLRAFVKKRQNVMPYRITSNVLDQMDIHEGDIVFLDISAEAVENVQPLQAVVVQLYGPGDEMRAVTLLRQFVPPSLLITNTSGRNESPLNTETDSVAIKGVIIATHRSMKR